MTKLQQKLARTYEERGYSATLTFWAENQDEINALSEKERNALKSMMSRYCRINGDEKNAAIVLAEKENPQKKEIMSSLFELARIYNDGKSIDKNALKSERLYELLFEGGDSDDLYKLGEMYKSGDGVPNKERKAAECFKKSAFTGNKLSAYRLGEMYMIGCGVEKSRVEAEKWYITASSEKSTYISRMAIPEGIEYIAESAFEGFENLRSVKIPESVKKINANAFNGCKNLESICSSNKNITAGMNAFKNCTNLDEDSKKIVESINYVFVKGNGYIDDFIIGKYPVTQDLFEEIMKENPSEFKGKSQPVENVSLDSVIRFCNLLSERDGLKPYYGFYNYEAIKSANGYRLPSISEWMYAANGGSQDCLHKYVGSSKLSNVAWFKDNSEGRTHDVGEKVPNELGIFDMLGNVWELCVDNDMYHMACIGCSFRTGSQGFADRRNWIQWNPNEFVSRSIGFRVVRNAD